MSSAVSLGGGEQRSKTGLSNLKQPLRGLRPVGVNRRAQCGRSSTCCINKSANITMRFCRRCSAGSLGESSLDFESMVEEVRRFVARMPPADSTTGSGCCPWSFSALGDERRAVRIW